MFWMHPRHQRQTVHVENHVGCIYTRQVGSRMRGMLRRYPGRKTIMASEETREAVKSAAKTW